MCDSPTQQTFYSILKSMVVAILSVFAITLWIYFSKAELLQLKLIHLFASELLSMKKLEIEKTKPTFIKSVSKAEY